MFIVLAIVLAVLRAFTSQHYFLAGRNGLLWIRDRMVRGMDSEAKADESISRHDVWGDGPPWVKSAVLTVLRPLPVYPDKQTS